MIGLGFDPTGLIDQIGQVEMTTGCAIERTSKVMLTRLTALGLHRFAFPAVAHDLLPSAAVDGLLGLDFFRDLLLTIDFRTGQISRTCICFRRREHATSQQRSSPAPLTHTA